MGETRALPYTCAEETKTTRPTSAPRAHSIKRCVPFAFTSHARAGSAMLRATLLIAARCSTASKGPCGYAAGSRTSPWKRVTCAPSDSRSATSGRPRNPEAPVTRTRTRGTLPPSPKTLRAFMPQASRRGAMSKRALITGITGQDGSYLAELLLAKGYEVFGLVRRLSVPNVVNIAGFQDRVTLLDGDLTDSSSLERAVRESQPKEIYNLAAQSFVG